MIKSKLFQISIFLKYKRVKKNYIWDYKGKNYVMKNMKY